MVYHLNQNTQLGNVTDEMLQKLMIKRQADENEKKAHKSKRNRQLDKAEIERFRRRGIKKRQKDLNEEEYNDLKVRDHRLAFSILVEERKGLEEQIAQYKAIIQNHEMGKGELTDIELTGIYKLYEHLMIQRRELDHHIARFDKKIADQVDTNADKEKFIKMLVEKYSET